MIVLLHIITESPIREPVARIGLPRLRCPQLIKQLHSHLLLVMVLLQVPLHHVRQLQLPDTIVRRLADNCRPTQLLQGETKVPIQRLR